MKRFLALALIISASTFGLVGCEEKAKDEVKEKITTPGGTTEKKITTEETKTGDHKDDAKPTTTDAPK